MRYLIIIVLFILPYRLLAQKRSHYETPRVTRYYAGYNDCSYQYRYSANQRHSFFPFSKAVSIRLISYQQGENLPIMITDPGTANVVIPIPPEDTMAVFSPMARNNFFINYCRIKEMRDLSKAAVDSLTDILYNVARKPIKFPKDYGNMGASCYMPLNAILFMDSRGRVTEYIEICFHCHKYYYSSPKTQEVNYCDQKWDMLKNFFIAQGLKYGTIETDNE
jgi:hypothetical protein